MRMRVLILGIACGLSGGCPSIFAADVTAAADVSPVTEETPRLYATAGLASSAFSSGPQAGLPGPVSGFGFVGAGNTGAEGAIGIATARPAGSLRVEVEARGRQSGDAASSGVPGSLLGEWSTMANLWRDVALSKRLGVYAGGGVGGGGYAVGQPSSTGDASLVPDAVSGLSWQAGGGLTYAVSERVTLDLGYRYRGLEPSQPADRMGGSEAILAVRIFEPFRDLWK